MGPLFGICLEGYLNICVFLCNCCSRAPNVSVRLYFVDLGLLFLKLSKHTKRLENISYILKVFSGEKTA